METKYKKCKQCGKRFPVYDYDGYVYVYPPRAWGRSKCKWFCSFNCRLFYTRDLPPKVENRGRKKEKIENDTN